MHGHAKQPVQSWTTLLRAGSLLGLCCVALLGCGSGSAATDAGADGGGGTPGTDANSGQAPSCTPFVACGGDLTGTWKIANSCLSADGRKSLEDSLKFCPADTTTVDTQTLSGTIQYDGHGAVKYDLVGEIKVSTSFPTSCLQPGENCSAYVATLVQTGATSPRCDATATGCDCSYTLSFAQKQQNTYVTNGSTVTETDSSDGTASTDEYCVAGNTLRVKGSDSIGVATR